MTKMLALAALLLAPAAAAAGEAPRAELFGGYALLRDDVLPEEKGTFHGFLLDGAWNVTDTLALAASASGHYKTFEGTDLSRTAFLAGPRLVLRGGQVSPFVHVLAGAVRTSGGVDVGFGVRVSRSETDPGGALGGGLDLHLGDRLGARVQGDWLLVKAEDDTEGSLRLAAGIVLRLGRR